MLCYHTHTHTHRYNELLASQTALRSQFVEVRSAPRAKIALEAELELVRVDLDKAHRERQAAAGELAALQDDLQARVAAAQDDASLQAQMDNMLAQCAKFRGESARLEIMHDTAQRRLAVKTKEAKELKAALDAEAARSVKAEDVADKARAERTGAVTELEKLQAEMAGALTQEAARKLQDRVAELEGMYKGVCREVHRLKEDAHIAHSQAALLSAAQQRTKADVEELRATNRLLAAKGDDEAIIGSLQHKYMALKSEYHTFAVEYERMREAHTVAKHKEQVLQMALDEAAAKLQALREQTRVRELAVKRAMEEVRAQRSGGLTVEETRALSIQLIKLEKTSEAQAQELDRAAAMRKAADTRAAAKELEVNKLREQLEDFKKAAANQGGDFGTMIRRLADLSEQLKRTQLKELRQGRELASLRDEKRTFESRRRKDEGKMRELDNRIVTAENNLRLKDDAHRQRVQQLQAALAKAKAKAKARATAGGGVEGGQVEVEATPVDVQGRGAGAGAGAGAVSSSSTAHGGGVVGGTDNVPESELRARLEAALSQLRTDTKTLRERADRIAELEQEVEAKEEAVAAVQRDVKQLRRLARRLRRKLRRNGIDVVEDEAVALSLSDGDDDDLEDDDDDDVDSGRRGGRRRHRDRDEQLGLAAKMAREKRRKLAVHAKELKKENESLREVARAKIDSLRAVVQKKQTIIEAYQARLERARADRDAERREEAVTREALVEQAYEENKAIIRKLREAVAQVQPQFLDGVGGEHGAAVAQEMLERQEQLQHELVVKERQLLAAQQRATVLQQALAQEKNRTGEALLAAEQARDQAALLQAQAAAPVKEERSLKGLVKTMKAHLKAKEKKIRSLAKQVDLLKVEYAKEQAELTKKYEKEKNALVVRHAISRGGGGGGGGGGAGSDGGGGGGGGAGERRSMADADSAMTRELKKVQAKMAAIHQRLRQATGRLSEAQEREAAARRAQQSMARELDRAVKQATQHESAAEQAASKLARVQRQLDDARRQLRTLRDRSRGGDSGGGGGASSGGGANGASLRAQEARIQQLQRQVKLLEAQNAAYRAAAADAEAKADGGGGGGGGGRRGGRGRDRSPSPGRRGKRSGRTGGVPQSEAMEKLQRKVEWSVRALSDKNRELQVCVCVCVCVCVPCCVMQQLRGSGSVALSPSLVVVGVDGWLLVADAMACGVTQTMRAEVESLRSDLQRAKSDASRAQQRARIAGKREEVGVCMGAAAVLLCAAWLLCSRVGVLCCAVLCCAVLCCAVLCCAVPCRAVLCCHPHTIMIIRHLC